jgi:predicted permease
MMTVPLDVRYGFRRLNNNVGFTVVAVACLALGICASITVFSVVNSLLLRPIPGVLGQDRLVSVTSKPQRDEVGDLVDRPLSYPELLRYREASRAFFDLVAYETVPVNLVVGGEPLRLKGQLVADNYFTVLGLRPAEGRLIAPGARAPEAPPEVVVSHALWRRAFPGRQGLGSVVSLNGHSFVVVGVAPPGFRGTQNEDDLDVWMPIATAPLVRTDLRESDLRDPDRRWLFGIFGRLAPGIDLERAQRQMNLLAGRLAGGPAPGKRPPELLLYPDLKIRPGTQRDLASTLGLLSIVVGLLMLVVCANLGGLLLVKAAARREEIGVRLALGVTRGQLVRQLLAESIALSLVGGVLGFVLSLWTVDLLQGLSLGRYLPRIRELAVDGRVVAFSIAVSLAAGTLFGLLPALWATRRQAAPLLHSAGDAAAPDSGRSHLQELSVVGQVAVSLMLLVTTGLFVRTLWNLRSIDPGFNCAEILNLRLDLSLQRYPEASGRRFYEQLLSQVPRLPGVRSAVLASWVPLSNGNGVEHYSVVQPRSAAAPRAQEVVCQYSVVVPGYFRELAIPVVRGREFSADDRPGAVPVMIVDESLAALLWPDRDPIGERVHVGPARAGEEREVVGVARSVRLRNLNEPDRPFFYLPLAQHYEPAMALQVRTASDPQRVADAIRALLRKLDPNLGVEVRSFEAEVKEALAQPRLLSWLLASFSLTALLVTAIGLYGTLAFMVSRRTRELGIRMALGARGVEIVAMVLQRGLALTLCGLLLGLVAASWATSVFSSFLFGVTPTDPAVFLVVAFLLTLVSLAASSLPAYSATRIDPMAIIRHE